MICLSQGGLRSLSASSIIILFLHIESGVMPLLKGLINKICLNQMSHQALHFIFLHQRALINL